MSAEKDALSGAVRQREAELLAAQSLVREKEEALSQEQQRSAQEKGELQGRLAEKVQPPREPGPLVGHTDWWEGARVLTAQSPAPFPCGDTPLPLPKAQA